MGVLYLLMCRERDSNPQTLRYTILSRACIPIPPSRHFIEPEAAGGIEPPYRSFADSRLTTWLRRQFLDRPLYPLFLVYIQYISNLNIREIFGNSVKPDTRFKAFFYFRHVFFVVLKLADLARNDN